MSPIISGPSRLLTRPRLACPSKLAHLGGLPITRIDLGLSAAVGQLRFKNATKQTKTKGGKPSENRSAQTKGYLAKGQAGGKGGSGASDGKTDRSEVIRQMLYQSDPELSDVARLAKLRKVVPDVEMHETIHRAWQLHLRHQREHQASQLERQYRAMNDALEQLRLADRRLYLKTIKDDNGSIHRLQNIVQPDSESLNINSTGKLVGLFPRQMRVPTESLPGDGKVWDNDWKNPTDPLAGC